MSSPSSSRFCISSRLSRTIFIGMPAFSLSRFSIRSLYLFWIMEIIRSILTVIYSVSFSSRPGIMLPSIHVLYDTKGMSCDSKAQVLSQSDSMFIRSVSLQDDLFKCFRKKNARLSKPGCG